MSNSEEKENQVPSMTDSDIQMNQSTSHFRAWPLILLAWIFFLNFLSRIILAPLLVTMEEDFGLSHTGAGSLFLLISIGYCLSLLGSGFVSARFSHKKTIAYSSLAVGLAVILIAISSKLWVIKMAFLLVGLGAGLYLPSGFATITTLVDIKNWGKGMAIHELAPSLAFVSAPLLVEVFLNWWSWRGLLISLGGTAVLTGYGFLRIGKGGDFRGETPTFTHLGSFITEPSFWIMVIQFVMAIGASLGVYTMAPLYLVKELGLAQGTANTFMALSRVPGVFVTLMAGWIIDHFGAKRSMVFFLLICGICTILLGVAPRNGVIPIIFFQQTLIGCFFPAGFAVLSRIGPPNIRNMAVSLTMPLAFLIGGGAIPAGMGFLAELVSFSTGMICLGGIVVAGVTLTRYLRFK